MGTGALAAAPVASSAEPVPPSSVTVVSEPGDRIGQGESRLWRTGAGEINVTYSVTGAPPGAVLNLALVEDGLRVRVPRGENAGRTLSHDAVVRLFRSFALDRAADRSLSLAWPEGVDRQKASLVAYAQDASTFEILGATGAKPGP